MPFHATIEEIAHVLQAEVLASNADSLRQCQGVTVDSREVSPGNLFFACRGESSDGHLFLVDSLVRGSAACVIEKSWAQSQYQNFLQGLPTTRSFCFLVVPDTTQALGKLAAYWRKKQKMPVVAVTGSNGKTTTKEMIGSLLSKVIGRGVLSQKSFNNHVGLPLTLLQSSAEDRWIVLEAGMNHPGELDYLGAIATPDVGVILNVGLAHLEFFQTIERIADAKCELLEHLSPSATAVVCGDDKNLIEGTRRLETRMKRSLHYSTFGFSPALDFYATHLSALGIRGIKFTLHHHADTILASIPHLGHHNVSNALAAFATVKSAFPETKIGDYVSALAQSKQPSMRFEIIEFPGLFLINDTYNANPVSMAASLETAATLTNGKDLIVILGDMLELGARSKELHAEIGRKVVSVHATKLIAVGNFADEVVNAAQKSGLQDAHATSDIMEVVDLALKELDSRVGVILVKGSRGMALERVVEMLQEALTAQEGSTL